MFVADTQIFTNSGWKTIDKVSGQDKVLVRNFLSEAEFIQPFAVKKRQYDGDITIIGAKDWELHVTPDHPIIYEIDNSGKFRNKRADEFVITNHNKIHRKFKYFTDAEPRKEFIKINDEFGRRWVTISDEDWYKLIGYILQRGFIRRKPGKPMLFIRLDEANYEQEVMILGDILDRLNVQWNIQYTEKTRPKIVVSSKNTLAYRVRNRLGGTTRKTMHLPDKMVYSSSKSLTKVLFETFMQNKTQFSTTNKALIDSLDIMGTLGGYSVRSSLIHKAGTEVFGTKTENDVYSLHIYNVPEVYSPKFKKKSVYSGYVYGIDLFEGQVYVKKGTVPTWTNPK